ncbi:hypothetical protein Hanom_Chr01g00063301 [Helianthus anomalus]
MSFAYTKVLFVFLELNVCSMRTTSAFCGPYLQTSVAEEVDQTSAVCKKKTVCFLTYASC